MANFRGDFICRQNKPGSGPPVSLARLARLKRLIQGVVGGGLLSLLGLTWVILSSAPPATAQTNTIPFELAWSSTELDSTRSVAWGDMDGDGDLDLAVGNSGQPNRVYCNGTDGLTTCWTAAHSHNTSSVAWGDVDGDGDLDLAVGNEGQPARLYRNNSGMLSTTGVWTSTETGPTSSLAWGDYDADGDLDLAVGNLGQPNRLYRNNEGTLTQTGVWTSTEAELTTSLAWGDYDGDGQFDDLAVGNSQGQPNRVYCYENDAWTSCWEAGAADDTYSVAWADVDDDGDLDLAVGNSGLDQVYCNDETTGLTLCWESDTPDATQSVAWGDVDGDGDLDLAIGNGQIPLGQANRVYRNDGVTGAGLPIFSLAWSSAEVGATWSLAWGDVDGDGDLDLAVGNHNHQPNRLYRNERGMLTESAVWSSEEMEQSTSLAWGDVDSDGDLDLAVGNNNLPNRLYRNDDGTLTQTGVWSSAESDTTWSLAWGDVDGDDDLDLAVGNLGQPNRLYRNDEGTLTQTGVWTSTEVEYTASLAWGDVDGDGDLDLAAGNNGLPNHLYRNDDGTLTRTWVWTSTEADSTTSLAWGDVDGDGDLDLAVGNLNQPNRLYRNDGGLLTPGGVWASTETDFTLSLAWGDVDGDGDLDLAVGNALAQPNRLYRNDGGKLTDSAVWSSGELEMTFSLAWGDYDGDGDLDLAAGNNGQPNRLYRNDGGSLVSAWTSLETNFTASVAWGDVDGDGDLDLASGGSGKNRLYLTQTPAQPLHPQQTTAISLSLYSEPAPTFNHMVTALAPANFYAVPGIRVATLPISYTIHDPELGSAWRIRGFFSPNGGGKWFPAMATSQTMTRHLASNVEHVYTWDIGNSRFFGQSDNVVFRLEALPGGDLPAQRPYVTAHTFPFRVRGSQIRVVNETGQPVQGALVYRLPGGQPMGGPETPFRTSAEGYLAGQAELNLGDQLVALWPISQTGKYTLYYTSAAPTETGLATFTVSHSGVQTLTVSAADPLLLFDLAISLEWDAAKNASFLDNLQERVKRASAALYDWTDGQAALGRVTVEQARQHWTEADVHILASNQTRPNANRGGIVTTTTVLSLTKPVTFSSGQIRIGPEWTRYGDVQGSLDDWSNVLAHELGHYALFLEDTYLGLDDRGVLIPITTCLDTAMNDPYFYSEFRYNDGAWAQACGDTLAELPDWTLIKLVYPQLQAPPPANSGPAQEPPELPFVFTQVEVKTQADPKLLGDFAVPISSNLADGQAYLFQLNQGLIDLGRPQPGSTLMPVRGVRQGDELCLFAVVAFACRPLLNKNASLEGQAYPAGWPPKIELTPINSTTLQILASDTSSPQLTATFYGNGARLLATTLTPGQVKTLSLSQTLDILVDIRGDQPATQRLVIGYATGGGPGHKRGHGGPVTGGDGNIILYMPNLPGDEFLAVQTALHLPQALPGGGVAIGRAHYIRPSIGLTDVSGGSLALQYFQLDVLVAGESAVSMANQTGAGASLTPQNIESLNQKEERLAIYYWNGRTWQPLPTTLSLTQNFASAPLVGPGLYVLTLPGQGPLQSLYLPVILKP